MGKNHGLERSMITFLHALPTCTTSLLHWPCWFDFCSQQALPTVWTFILEGLFGWQMSQFMRPRLLKPLEHHRRPLGFQRARPTTLHLLFSHGPTTLAGVSLLAACVLLLGPSDTPASFPFIPNSADTTQDSEQSRLSLLTHMLGF